MMDDYFNGFMDEGTNLPNELAADLQLVLAAYLAANGENAAMMLFLKAELLFSFLAERCSMLFAVQEDHVVDVWRIEDRTRVRAGTGGLTAPRKLYFAADLSAMKTPGEEIPFDMMVVLADVEREAGMYRDMTYQELYAKIMTYSTDERPLLVTAFRKAQFRRMKAFKVLDAQRGRTCSALDEGHSLLIHLQGRLGTKRNVWQLPPRALPPPPMSNPFSWMYKGMEVTAERDERFLFQAVQTERDSNWISTGPPTDRAPNPPSAFQKSKDAATPPNTRANIQYQKRPRTDSHQSALTNSRFLPFYASTPRDDVQDAARGQEQLGFFTASTQELNVTSSLRENLTPPRVATKPAACTPKVKKTHRPLQPATSPTSSAYIRILLSVHQSYALMEVEKDYMIADIVELVHEASPKDFPLADIRLAYKNKILRPNIYFHELGYNDGDVIEVLIQQRYASSPIGRAPTTAGEEDKISLSLTASTQSLSAMSTLRQNLIYSPIGRARAPAVGAKYGETLSSDITQVISFNSTLRLKLHSPLMQDPLSPAYDYLIDNDASAATSHSNVSASPGVSKLVKPSKGNNSTFSTSSMEDDRDGGQRSVHNLTVCNDTILEGSSFLNATVIDGLFDTISTTGTNSNDPTWQPKNWRDVKTVKDDEKELWADRLRDRKAGRTKKELPVDNCYKCQMRKEVNDESGVPLCRNCLREFCRAIRTASATPNICRCTAKRTCPRCRLSEWKKIGCRAPKR